MHKLSWMCSSAVHGEHVSVMHGQPQLLTKGVHLITMENDMPPDLVNAAGMAQLGAKFC